MPLSILKPSTARRDRAPELCAPTSFAPELPCAGFTILEIVVVLLVMGIVAAVAAPSFYVSLRHHQVESAAKRVKLDLEHTQHLARVKSQPQKLEFTSATAYELSPGVESLGSGETYSVDLARAPYELASVDIDLGDPEITAVEFDGFGNASAGGTIELSIGNEVRIVEIDVDSSQITILDP